MTPHLCSNTGRLYIQTRPFARDSAELHHALAAGFAEAQREVARVQAQSPDPGDHAGLSTRENHRALLELLNPGLIIVDPLPVDHVVTPALISTPVAPSCSSPARRQIPPEIRARRNAMADAYFARRERERAARL